MFRVYIQRESSTVILPLMRTMADVRAFVEDANERCVHALYRVFEVQPDGGEQFQLAYALSRGSMRIHADVTIPKEYW